MASHVNPVEGDSRDTVSVRYLTCAREQRELARLAFTSRVVIELVVMMVMMMMVVMMHRMCASNSRNGDSGKNDEGDQMAH